MTTIPENYYQEIIIKVEERFRDNPFTTQYQLHRFNEYISKRDNNKIVRMYLACMTMMRRALDQDESDFLKDITNKEENWVGISLAISMGIQKAYVKRQVNEFI